MAAAGIELREPNSRCSGHNGLNLLFNRTKYRRHTCAVTSSTPIASMEGSWEVSVANLDYTGITIDTGNVRRHFETGKRAGLGSLRYCRRRQTR